jgi:hypothetical protein
MKCLGYYLLILCVFLGVFLLLVPADESDVELVIENLEMPHNLLQQSIINGQV